MWKRVFRARTLVYLALLVSIVGGMAGSLWLREPLKVDVIRDRGALARESAPGVIENVYRLQIMNTGESAHQFAIAAEGVPGLAVVGVDQPVPIAGASSRLVPVRLQAPADAGVPGANSIEFVVTSVGGVKLARREKSTFLFPR